VASLGDSLASEESGGDYSDTRNGIALSPAGVRVRPPVRRELEEDPASVRAPGAWRIQAPGGEAVTAGSTSGSGA
jgi:hypothetical protein